MRNETVKDTPTTQFVRSLVYGAKVIGYWVAVFLSMMVLIALVLVGLALPIVATFTNDNAFWLFLYVPAFAVYVVLFALSDMAGGWFGEFISGDLVPNR